MASRKERSRIMSGTLNLLPPSDKIPDGDAIIHENWRIDQQGELRSRNGSVEEAGPVGSGTFHTLGRTGNDRYAGIGTHLYWGPTLASDIASGFDGTALGIAFYQGAAWVMNPAKQLRVVGTTARNWGIAAPVAAPIATAGSPVVTLLNPYNSSLYLSYVGYFDTSGAFVDKSGSMAYGSSPGTDSGVVPAYANSSVNATWYLVTNLSPGHDTRTGGNAQDADSFQLRFYCAQPEFIDSISVTLFSNQNTLGNAAPQVQATISGDALNQSRQGWTTLAIRRAIDFTTADLPTVTNDDGSVSPDPYNVDARAAEIGALLGQPHFLEYAGSQQLSGFGPTWTTQQTAGGFPTFTSGGFQLPSQFNWANVTGIEIVVFLKSPVGFGLGAFSIVGSILGTLNGSISYFLSYANADGQDSNPSPEADVTAANQSVTLSSLPVSPDPQVVQRFLYRIGGGLTQAYRVATIPDNSSTTFIDSMDNRTAQNLGITMPVNRDLPPPCFGVIGAYFGKLIAFGEAANPARYFWTPAAQPWFFPGADQDTGNWEDAGNYDDPILAMTDHKRALVIYKARSIWRLDGDPVNVDPVRTNANIGIIGRRAVVSAGSVDYFAGPEGIYKFNQDFETKISDAIDPIFKGDFVELASGEFLPPIDRGTMSSSVMELVNDRLRFSYPESGHTLPNVVAIYHIETGRWGREIYNLQAPAPSAMHYDGPGNAFMLGMTGVSGGYLYHCEQITNTADNGNAIHLRWQSRYSDQGLPDNFKYYSDLEIDFQTAIGAQSAASMTVTLLYDNGTQVALGPISSATRTTKIFQLGQPDATDGGTGNNFGLKAKRAAIRLVGDCMSQVIIYGTYLHWYPVERQATEFDSGVIATERVRQVDYLEFEVTATGQPISYLTSSDLPGNVLVERLFGGGVPGFSAPNGRGTDRFRLPNIVEGRQLRFTLGSNSPFQLHAARIRQREVGEYLDGSTGEFYLSPEFSVAPGRAGELRDLLLDYDSSGGTGQLLIYSDLPGGAMVLRRTITIPLRTTRAPFAFAFEDGADLLPYGQLFQIKITPPVGGILRLHGRAELRVRQIGVYFDGSVGERWETQPLDLVGGIGEFREVVIVAQAAGPMLFEFLTELPGSDMQVRSNFTFSTVATSTGRVPIYFRVPGSTKGRLQKFRITGPYVCRLFEVRVYGRLLGGNPSAWQWISLPVEPTPDEWQHIQMPVRSTPEAFTWVDLPVDTIE